MPATVGTFANAAWVTKDPRTLKKATPPTLTEQYTPPPTVIPPAEEKIAEDEKRSPDGSIFL